MEWCSSLVLNVNMLKLKKSDNFTSIQNYSPLTTLNQRWTLKRRLEGAGQHRKGNLQIPAWYFKVLTLCLWALYVWIRSPVSTNQHFTVLSALPEYRWRFTSWGERKAHQQWPLRHLRERTALKGLIPSHSFQLNNEQQTAPWNRGVVSKPTLSSSQSHLPLTSGS